MHLDNVAIIWQDMRSFLTPEKEKVQKELLAKYQVELAQATWWQGFWKRRRIANELHQILRQRVREHLKKLHNLPDDLLDEMFKR